MSIESRSPRTFRRITISVPEALIAGLDTHVAAGAAENRTDLINDAIERELRRLHRDAIDAEILALASDPEYLALDKQLADEFDTSDAEVWAMLDEEFGPEPAGGSG